jgi:hypothetical protein
MGKSVRSERCDGEAHRSCAADEGHPPDWTDGGKSVSDPENPVRGNRFRANRACSQELYSLFALSGCSFTKRCEAVRSVEDKSMYVIFREARSTTCRPHQAHGAVAGPEQRRDRTAQAALRSPLRFQVLPANDSAGNDMKPCRKECRDIPGAVGSRGRWEPGAASVSAAALPASAATGPAGTAGTPRRAARHRPASLRGLPFLPSAPDFLTGQKAGNRRQKRSPSTVGSSLPGMSSPHAPSGGGVRRKGGSEGLLSAPLIHGLP